MAAADGGEGVAQCDTFRGKQPHERGYFLFSIGDKLYRSRHATRKATPPREPARFRAVLCGTVWHEATRKALENLGFRVFVKSLAVPIKGLARR